jgi:hypothetical protein
MIEVDLLATPEREALEIGHLMADMKARDLGVLSRDHPRGWNVLYEQRPTPSRACLREQPPKRWRTLEVLLDVAEVRKRTSSVDGAQGSGFDLPMVLHWRLP